jgi:large subunit ribosomal protein L28
MAMQCASCSKGVQYGHNVSHSKRRTVRTFKPNLQPVKVLIDGTSKRVKLCAKCLRMYKRTMVANAASRVASQVVA